MPSVRSSINLYTISLCRSPRRLSGGRSPPGGQGSFFKILYRASSPPLMVRARGKLTTAPLARPAAHRRIGGADAERLEQPLAQVDDAPAHCAVDRRRRALLHDADQ